MNYFDALEASVTLAEAMAELRKHGFTATVREADKVLIDTETGEQIAEPDEWGDYAGADIVGHLGY